MSADNYFEGASEKSNALRVCIVDDDAFVTTSLATILSAEPDFEVAGEAHDGLAACDLFSQTMPDILLMDIQMPRMNGLEAAECILETSPEARIVFLTTFSDDEYIVRALRLGVRGYLIKQEVATIAPALRSVFAGQSVLGGEVLGRMETLMQASGKEAVSKEHVNAQGVGSGEGTKDGAEELRALELALASLSEREDAVVELVAEGLDNKEIAGKLYISEGTVRNHISVILQKLALKNRTQIAIAYYRARKVGS